MADLAAASDILFLCAAGGPGVRNLVDRPVLEALGPKGIFVNVSRGWLVDEPVLIELLRDSKLGGAGLDVFADEPVVPSELVAMPNVVLTPHVASNTAETGKAMDDSVLANIQSWFAGRGAVDPVM